jgi:hypothetical protein
MFYAISFMSYDKILLTERGAHMNKKALFETMQCNRKTFDKWYSDMIDTGILKQFSTSADETVVAKEYIQVINESFVKGGIKGNKQSYMKVFIDTIREIYDTNIGQNMNSVGMILSLIPYVNKEYNVMCHNTMCKNDEKLNLITANELSDAFGYGRDIGKMQRALTKITLKNGEPIILFATNGDKKNDTIMVNPMLMYSGGDIDTSHVIFRRYVAKQAHLKSKKEEKVKNIAISTVPTTVPLFVDNSTKRI